MRGSAKREGGKRKRWSGVTGTEEHKQRDKGQREESGSLRVEEEEGETSVCVCYRGRTWKSDRQLSGNKSNEMVWEMEGRRC